MEASTIPTTAAIEPATPATRVAPARITAGPLLRLRSDEQLVRLFRAGSDDAFRVIHDRYRTRLFAYARQMLGGSRADAEDALQDVFVRAHRALRANDRDVSLRAWLYRIAHNRCIDELRRVGGNGFTIGAPSEVLELVQAPASDPMDAVEQRESLRRLVADVQRLPEQQRSALLMREISGMAYQDLAGALDVTVPAVKSLLVRARIGLAQAAEARDTACAAIRADLADAHERGVRASGLVKRHLHDCKGCSAYKKELRAVDARLAALVPALGPAALVAKLLGIGGSGAAAGSGASAAGGATAGAAVATAGAGAAGVSASHIAAAVAVAVVSAGGAVEVHHSLAPHRRPQAAIHRSVAAPAAPALQAPAIAAPTAADVLATDAARRRDAARRLHLRLIPGINADKAVLVPAAPTLDADATSPGNGGAAAPGEEPPADSLQPVTPAPTPEEGATAGDVNPIEASSGSSSTPPTAGSTSPPTEPPPADAAPPATSVAPPAAAAPAPTTPPTSASTGGATYKSR